METQDDKQQQSQEPAGGQALTEITFNGKTYSVDDLGSLQDIVKQTEHNLLSDYTRKTQGVAQEREEIKKKQEALQKDLQFLRENYWVMSLEDPRSVYEPLIEGGRGIVGRVPSKEEVEGALSNSSDGGSEYNTKSNKNVSSIFSDPKVATLETELARLQKQLNSVIEVTNESSVDRVRREMSELIKTKYPNAIPDDVGTAMTNFYLSNNRHPSREQIESIVRDNHLRVSKLIAAKTKGEEGAGAPTGNRVATPQAGGGTPTPPARKQVSIEDVDAFNAQLRKSMEGKNLVRK